MIVAGHHVLGAQVEKRSWRRPVDRLHEPCVRAVHRVAQCRSALGQHREPDEDHSEEDGFPQGHVRLVYDIIPWGGRLGKRVRPRECRNAHAVPCQAACSVKVFDECRHVDARRTVRPLLGAPLRPVGHVRLVCRSHSVWDTTSERRNSLPRGWNCLSNVPGLALWAVNIRRMWPAAVLVLLTLLTGSAIQAEDWPAFRGPTGQGHSAERGLPLTWSESSNVRWKTPVAGRGWSSPVVADGRVWLTTATNDGAGSLRLVGYAADTGLEIVNAEVFRVAETASANPKNSQASPTPIVRGDRVYVHFGADGTAALTTDGEVVWKARFPYVTQHGNGGSPVLHDGRLFLSVDGYDTAYVVALDAATGKEQWRAMRREPISQAYSTPLIIRVGDRDQLFSIGAFRATAYDPESGDELWEVSYGDGFSNVPAPVFGHGMVYIATGFQTPSLLAVRADGEGDVTRTHTAWTLRRGAPLTPSPLLVGDELYLVTDFGIATCVDARTGAIHWQERLGGSHSASPVFVDGRIYFQNENGVTRVIEPGTEFKQLATSELDGASLASPAVADGSFFIRTEGHLYRIGS